MTKGTTAVPKINIHGFKLHNKVQATKDPQLKNVLDKYNVWLKESLKINGRTREDINRLVTLLNTYKNFAEPVFDSRANSAQEVLQPSIMEEFMEVLFCQLKNEINEDLPVREPEAGYIELMFNPKNVHSLASVPELTIRRKDHDFVIGSRVKVAFSSINSDKSGEREEDLVIPAVAIEVKRYLERNMLDECAGTASRVKSATPYCLYIIVSEYLKMDDCRPELSEIDEIYILRKQRNSERISAEFKANPIDGDLVWDMYCLVISHLKRIWWDPESALKSGKLFNY